MQDPMRNIKIAPLSARTVLSTNTIISILKKYVDGWFMHIRSHIKEYQARGAPHYHFLLWIHSAPVAGVDPPEKVLAWIEKRITCQIPNKDKEPELYDLVTQYQMHKCSAYCKKPKKC